MRDKARGIIFLIVFGAAAGYYLIEPWAVTFVDDGPYYAESYAGDTDGLRVQSAVELRRLGAAVYRLDSRNLPGREESVLVLSDTDGRVRWAKLPVKPNGELGTVSLIESSLTWNLGWRVRIAPSRQEAGNLYISPAGGFRFLNHSW